MGESDHDDFFYGVFAGRLATCSVTEYRGEGKVIAEVKHCPSIPAMVGRRYLVTGAKTTSKPAAA